MTYRCIAISLALCFCLHLSTSVNADDPAAVLNDAISEFKETVAEARSTIIASLDREKDKLQAAGKLTELIDIKNEISTFKESGKLPTTIATEPVINRLKRSRDQLLSAYERAVREHTRRGDIDAAKKVQAELGKLKKESITNVFSAPQTFTPLFDGSSIKGWHTFPSDNKNWSVKDNCLVGKGDESYLVTDRNDWKDFTLRAEVWISEGENGGILLRCPADGKFGYEVDINTPRRGTKETGTIRVYPTSGDGRAIASVVKPPHSTSSWFNISITVLGEQLTVKVNDSVVCSIEDKSKSFRTGSISLQHFVSGSEIKFRNIEILEH